MACTTILVGKKASYDGSTMIARNDDSIVSREVRNLGAPRNELSCV